MSTAAVRNPTVPTGNGSGPPPAVLVEGVSKTFRLPHQQYTTLKERVLHPWRSTDYDELHALKDVSLEIAEGEFFGIVGRNGSGKSTLLKCIAGIYGTDSGRIMIHGRLSPFIELGVGFNMDLNARDNVLINAIMLGLSRRQAQKRFEHVVAFAELEDFMDLRLKNYSSGMLVRLAFAISIQVDAETLLIDEVLAVGDAAFQQKCFDEFFRLKREGKTIIFVSHDMYSIERFCDRAMLIEHGVMTRIGEPRQIGRAYNELNFGQLAHDAPPERDAGAGTAIVDAWFEDEHGRACYGLEPGGGPGHVFRGEVRREPARAGLRRHAAQPGRTHDHRGALRRARRVERFLFSGRSGDRALRGAGLAGA